MNFKLDNRATLIKIINSLTESDIKLLLVYATGYETGKISQINSSEQLHKSEENKLA